MPLCSVVIPAYNVEDYVAEAIESALSQTYPEIEVIVVNDGSTDATADAIAPYRDRIVYIEQDNRGLPAARNRAISAARGEYIALLDADDVHFPNRVERLVGFLTSHPEFGAAIAKGSRRMPFWRTFRSEDQRFWITQYYFLRSSVLRRDLFVRHGMYDEELGGCADWELWIRFIAAGERVGYVDERLGYRRLREGSLSADWRHYLRDSLVMLERVMTKGIRLPGLAGRLEVARGKVALLDGEYRRARHHFASAVRDGQLAPSTRLQALPFAVAPGAAWRLYCVLRTRWESRRRAASNRSLPAPDEPIRIRKPNEARYPEPSPVDRPDGG